MLQVEATDKSTVTKARFAEFRAETGMTPLTAARAAVVVNTTTAFESTATLDPKWLRIELVQVGLFLGS